MPTLEDVSSCAPIVLGTHCDCWAVGETCCECGEDDDSPVCYPDSADGGDYDDEEDDGYLEDDEDEDYDGLFDDDDENDFDFDDED